MIGEKLMEEPKTKGECWVVFESFRLLLPLNVDYAFENAIELVKINNEVYRKLNP